NIMADDLPGYSSGPPSYAPTGTGSSDASEPLVHPSSSFNRARQVSDAPPPSRVSLLASQYEAIDNPYAPPSLSQQTIAQTLINQPFPAPAAQAHRIDRTTQATISPMTRPRQPPLPPLHPSAGDPGDHISPSLLRGEVGTDHTPRLRKLIGRGRRLAL
ncbi:hypothetical protein BGX38DRAFT_1203019, partial [Terfezia claveryi]